jgi:amino acid transporter
MTYSFARVAFGPFGGYLTGTAILIEYAIAPAAIAVFIGSYCENTSNGGNSKHDFKRFTCTFKMNAHKN